MPVIAVVAQHNLVEKTVSNIKEATVRSEKAVTVE